MVYYTIFRGSSLQVLQGYAYVAQAGFGVGVECFFLWGGGGGLGFGDFRA